ncbi:uncharacterized protein LOC103316094 [Nasonia vitripennis]|uniref:Peptidase aspartic putative domain-containing protein n=1 Tax=Nasonia vitripennis TaxID=7425 RepID=A0A7M7QBN7_NASVI|nr:uncharacterized protein LOC103316094 [Nasonia vitripennis]XP_031784831.1 uncharacterized protein LOC103316094 [Nasonia vitripennis]
MGECDDLLADQKRLFNLMQQIAAVTKTETSQTFNAADVEARLGLLEAYWEKFSDHDLVLQRDAKTLKARSYFTKNMFDGGLGAYLTGKAWLSERVRTLRAPPPARAPSETAAAGAVSHQAALEKLKLPRFSGTQREWEAFKERFELLVLDDATMPLVIKFQHLLNCLEGEAAEKLKGIQIIATNFQTAWETLCRRYDNKFLRFLVQMKALSTLPSAAKEYVSHINQLLNTTNESINTFRALGRPVEHWDDVLIHFIECKLAPTTRMDWVKEIESKKSSKMADEFPTYEELRKFLEDRVQTLDIADTDLESSSQRTQVESSKKSVSAQRTGRKGAYSATQRAGRAGSKQKCSFCSADHFVGYCQKFGACSPTQRRQHAESARLCTNCLSSHHSINACTSKGRCLACGDKHHTRLHEEKKTPGNSSVGVTSAGKSTVAHALTDSVNSFFATRETSILLSTACVVLESDHGRAMTVRALLDSGSEESSISEHVARALGLPSTTVNVATDRELQTSSLHITVDQELTKAITRFWEIETVSAGTRLSPQEEECYAHFRRTYYRDKKGRFNVRLSVREPPTELDTQMIAAACFS